MYRRVSQITRLTLLLAALALFTVESRAQVTHVGFKTGANVSTFRGDTKMLVENMDFSRLHRRTSFQFGGFALVELTDNFTLHPELLYIQKGAIQTGDNLEAADITGTYRFSYLQLPLLLEYRIGTGRDIIPVVYAGPSAALQVASGLEVEFRNNTELNSFADVTSTYNFGGIVGAGLRLRFRDSQLLTFDLQYNPGFSDIAAEDDVVLRTDSVIISLGLALSL